MLQYLCGWAAVLLGLLTCWLARAVCLLMLFERLKHAACALWTRSKQQQYCDMGAHDTATNLLALPDHCLLAVMQCCSQDTPSMLSAATAHSRLHQAAVEAGGIAAGQLRKDQVKSLLLYLAKHGQHVRSLDLRASSSQDDVQLRELPLSLTKLDSLQLGGMTLQLQPGLGESQGVLRAGFPLTRLELSNCTLLDRGHGMMGLAAALQLLPDLEHLKVTADARPGFGFPTDVFPHLQKLTCLLLRGGRCLDIADGSILHAALQPLQALTRLADLELVSPASSYGERVTADMLSSADHLTRLVLSGHWLEPHALADKSQLQHLTLSGCGLRNGRGTGVTELLSVLQRLTQLTHLDLEHSMFVFEFDNDVDLPHPAAYASLTASSKLQHLDFRRNTLEAAAWQNMCPPGRTLPQLRHLDITLVTEAVETRNLALPDTSALASCCPGLQSLRCSIPCFTVQLAPLQQLTGLHTLAMGAENDDELEGVQALCQLTGLQRLELNLYVPEGAEPRFLQLTQLTRLTHLYCTQCGVVKEICCSSQDPASEHVWRQLQQLLWPPALETTAYVE